MPGRPLVLAAALAAVAATVTLAACSGNATPHAAPPPTAATQTPDTPLAPSTPAPLPTLPAASPTAATPAPATASAAPAAHATTRAATAPTSHAARPAAAPTHSAATQPGTGTGTRASSITVYGLPIPVVVGPQYRCLNYGAQFTNSDSAPAADTRPAVLEVYLENANTMNRQGGSVATVTLPAPGTIPAGQSVVETKNVCVQIPAGDTVADRLVSS